MSKATEKGFVDGKQYVLKNLLDGDSHHKFENGDVVELSWDDGSESPQFRRLSDGVTAYVNLKRLVEYVPEPKVAVEPLTYTIESNKDNTVVFVRKQLSLDQIKRIMDILGE